jgi:predicted DNA-binding transcriptional regulator AlpA
MAMPTDTLLSSEEVADRLGLTVATLWNWRWRGKGPASFKVGGRLRYRDSEVQRWLAEQEGQEQSNSPA